MIEKPKVFIPETPLTTVLQKMIETRHKRFPVVDGHFVVGIIAKEYILRASRQSAKGQLPPRLQSSEGGEFLKASNTGSL